MEKNTSEEIKTLLIITLVIILVTVGLYFFTEKILNKKEEVEEVEETISYTEILMGTMLDLPDEEYFVIAYDKTNEETSMFETLYKRYFNKEGALPIYEVNLGIGFNKKYLSDESNTKPKSLEDVQIKDVGLFLIKNGKISKYYESYEDIEKAFV